MIGDWLLITFVFACLWVFWAWLNLLFTAISAYHDACRRDDQGEDVARRSSRSEKASSALPR